MTDVVERTLPAPSPVVNVETKRFWDATAESRLLLPRCNDCGIVIWYPRAFCPECSSFDVIARPRPAPPYWRVIDPSACVNDWNMMACLS